MPSPSSIGPYRVLSRLGAGGMAETYVALRRGPGDFEQRVCLKRIRGELDQDPEFVRQFLSEATLAASLRHANIAQVLDFGREGGDYYLALELIDGLDLRELIERAGAGLDPRLTLHIATEVCTALDFAHRGSAPGGARGIVHRDISPSNVLVSTEGEVKLADFGIARPLQGPKYTRTGIIKGKTAYMAPEYARSAEFDVRCDLFSLGVTLYECLAGVRPYDGSTDLEVFERAARGEHVPLGELAPAAPRELVGAVERLIAPDPAARFASASALLDVLVRLATDGTGRRELGVLVRRLRDQRPSAAETSQAKGIAAYAPTEHSDVAGAVAPTRTLALDADARGAARITDPVLDEAPGPSRRLAWLTLGVASLVAAGVAWTALERAGVTPDTETAPAVADTTAVTTPAPAPAAIAPAPVAPAAIVQPGVPSSAPPAPAPTDAAQAAAPTAPPAAVTARRALVRIVVVPYGKVSVDGRDLGPAPVEVKLAPGEHTAVAQVRGAPVRKTFSVRAGQRTEITLQ